MALPAVDFNQAPFLVIWETTQACALACRHCRASARPWRDPLELTTDEGRRLVDMTAEMGTPIIVFSGDYPMSRPDLTDFIAHAKRRGLRAATIPAATAALDRDAVFRIRDAGADQMALSLDFPDAASHDAFRGVEGAFQKTIDAVGWAHLARLPLQINTTVCGMNADRLEEMADFVGGLDIVFWEVFFLVPMGRGALLGGLSQRTDASPPASQDMNARPSGAPAARTRAAAMYRQRAGTIKRWRAPVRRGRRRPGSRPETPARRT